MKGLITIIFMALLLFTACSSGSQSSESYISSMSSDSSVSAINETETPSFSDVDKARLTKSAEVLTQQLVLTVFSPEDLKAGVIPKPDSADITRFVIASVVLMEDKDYLYNSFFYLDKDGYWNFPEDKLAQLVDEVFGVENWKFEESEELKYNAGAEKFSIMSGFGIGNNLELRNTDTKIDDRKSEVSVLYEVHTSSQFPSSEKIGTYQTHFEILDNEGQFYLRYIETVVK